MAYYVYCHTNKANGKRYVGITSQLPLARWQNGKHYSKHKRFYADILKFGWDGFDHAVLCSDLSKEDAEEIEMNLIDGLDLTNKEKGYNAYRAGINNPKMSEKTRAHLSNISSGNKNPFYAQKHTEETKRLMSEHRMKKAVLCVETGIVYKSTREAERITGADHGDISKCCKGKKITCGGFHWKYWEGVI